MIEGNNELIPGVTVGFTKTGIDGDVVNTWSTAHVIAATGKFDEIEPVQHYSEYFLGQDKKYEDVGKPGLHAAVMERSNPVTVGVFDELVDEFNAQLPQIKATRDMGAVQAFVDRAYRLKEELPEQQKSND